MALVYIGLGSNLDNPLAQVCGALEELAEIPQSRLIANSRLYQSKAIGPEQDDFINAAALIDTALDPIALLDQLQKIEQHHQRQRFQHWGPRTLDLDILLYDLEVIHLERLIVPHAYLTQRAFVIYPLLDIDPELVLPDGRYIKDCLVNCSGQEIHPLCADQQPRISL